MRVLTRRFKSINEALGQLAIELIIDGETVPVRNAVGDVVITKDLPDYNVVFAPGHNNICTLPTRKFPAKNSQSEFLWYMTGNPKADVVSKYMKNWLNYADENGNVNSNYGVYWKKYIPEIIELLKHDKMSRRAVMNIYHLGNAPFGKDTPCTLTIQFVIRANKLNMIVMMRSNDIWYGLSIDQFCNSLLHQLVYHSLLTYYPDLELGWYSHHAGSMHVYMSESSGNATITEETLSKLYQEFSATTDHGTSLVLPPHVNFGNFWETAGEVFDKERFDYFKQYVI